MRSVLALADESLPYGAARGMSKSLDAFLKMADPKDHRARQQNSPGARRNVNYLRTLPKHVLIKELLRREMREKAKADARVRKERFLLRHKNAD